MTNKVATTMRRYAFCAMPLVLVSSVANVSACAQTTSPTAQVQNQSQNQAQFSEAQIEQLLAPIALYPDPLLSQILMASTYPLEVVEAARWSRDNPAMKGAALQDAMQTQSWDPSVKALTAVPQTLDMMSDKLGWTQELGDAFLAQQHDVLAAVQKLRAEAQAAGNLQSTPQQIVTTAPRPSDAVAAGAPQPIVIEPVNPDVYYVPVYNPAVAFGTWDDPAYPPFYWSPPGFAASNIVSFAAGVAVGTAIWGGCDWWHNKVIINVNRYNIFNHTNINIANNTWIHDPEHRHDVPYPNANVAQRFGRTNDAAARDAFRDRLDNQPNDVFRDRADEQHPDMFHRPEGEATQADRKMAPALRDRRDGEFRRDYNRVAERAIPERREASPSHDDSRRLMRSRAQIFHSERRPVERGGFHVRGDERIDFD